MNETQLSNLHNTASSLLNVSTDIFWQSLPVAFLIAILIIFLGSNINGTSIETLFRRTIMAIFLVIGFRWISSLFVGFESGLVTAFGGDADLSQLFSNVAKKASDIKSESSLSWLNFGEVGLSLISTGSFIILAIIKKFLDVLQLTIWNVLHILGPIAFLGCLFPSFHSIPKGVFTSLLEISLWKPFWVILAKILMAIGFGEAPEGVSAWFDMAIMNFAVAGLMISTPFLVHSFLSGTISSMGGALTQTMLAGTGANLLSVPMNTIRNSTQKIKDGISNSPSKMATKMFFRGDKKQNFKNQINNKNQKGVQSNGISKTNGSPKRIS